MFQKVLQQLFQGPALEASPERFPAHARSKMLDRTPNVGPSIFRGVCPIMLAGQKEMFKKVAMPLLSIMLEVLLLCYLRRFMALT